MFSPAQVATEVGSLAAMFEGILPVVLGVTGVSDVLQNKVAAGIDGLRASAAAIATADAASGPSIMTRVSNDANAVLSVLARMALPPMVALPVRIAQAILPSLVVAGSMVFEAVAVAPPVEPPAPPVAAPDPEPAPATTPDPAPAADPAPAGAASSDPAPAATV